MELAYFTIYEDKNMVDHIKKTWKERITWKFWIKYKTVPKSNFIVVQEKRAIFCHPNFKKELEEYIESLT